MMTAASTPRGIRNNNPGNIRWGDSWQGLLPADQRTDKDFCQFSSPEYGIRAMAVVLRNYGNRDGVVGVGQSGIDTVYEIIRRWAPPNENNTDAYIASVAVKIGKDPKDHIDVNDAATMLKVLPAIIQHENGMQPYSDAQFKSALTKANYVV